MTTRYVQPGGVSDHVATVDTASGDVVVMGKMIGVALNSAAIGQTVRVKTEGVFLVPKKPADVFAKGDFVLWDGAIKQFKVGNGGPCCVAWEAAAGPATEMLVKFTGATSV